MTRIKRLRAKPYFERLAFELDVIRQMGFPGYFLIVADFIQWAKARGIPVGPGADQELGHWWPGLYLLPILILEMGTSI